MPHYYEDDYHRIMLGDRVLYGGEPGTIVFLVEEDAYLPPFTKEEWGHHIRDGIGMLWDNGELFLLDTPDEDLILVNRREATE